MDELSLIIEGIDVKVKKLLIRNNQLKDKVLHLEEEKNVLSAEISSLVSRLRETEQELSEAKVATVLKKEDAGQARQRINELLRDIEKCQTLLNR